MNLSKLTLLLLFLTSGRMLSCDCECVNDCSFHKVVKNSKFVALVRVISYDNYLSSNIDGYGGKMPGSMTVEIIKKYKGRETRQKIKIWGDSGKDCRPYTGTFSIGEYFLIAPDKIEKPKTPKESTSDYEFFSCSTDFLKVDMKTAIAFGQYSKTLNKITLKAFEKSLL